MRRIFKCSRYLNLSKPSLDADTRCHLLWVITEYGQYIRDRYQNLMSALAEEERIEYTINLLDLFHLLGNFEGRLVAGAQMSEQDLELIEAWDEELQQLTN